MDLYSHLPLIVEQWWRGLNIVLAAVCLVFVIMGIKREWRSLDAADRLMAKSFALLLFVVGFASFESMVQRNPVGWRVGLVTVACTWILWGLVLLARKRRQK